MLKHLRWQLTLLYLLAALGLTALLGAGSYSLLRSTFENTTDLALQYKMAATFEDYGLPLPEDLRDARRTWIQTYAVEGPLFQEDREDGDEGDGDEHDKDEHEEDDREESDEEGEGYEDELYDARLAALFVFPMDSHGNLISSPNTGQPPLAPDLKAVEAASLAGIDWRTISLQNGPRVRLFTYRTWAEAGVPALIQVGRVVEDQDRALSQFLAQLLLLGGASVIILSFLSWWLSGRSLGPAQKAWEQQQIFVANASHELRTPLTLIRASAEYGLMINPDTETRPLLEDIRKECDYMNRQVEDLLLLSRLDARRLMLERIRIDLPLLLSETSAQMQHLAREKEIHLVLGEAAGAILGDPLRMRQVLLILLDNAFRFTASGGTVRLESQVIKRHVFISVVDNGCGIAPEHFTHIFERFYQAAGAGPGEAHSNGLGLSIAKALVQAQGGAIHLESQVGRGTRVKLDFPAADGF